MSNFIFFFSYILFVLFCFVFCFFFFLSLGLRPKTYVATTSINIHHIYILLFVSHWDILLFFLNFIARIEDQSHQARQIESLRARVLFCSGWPGS